MPSSLLRKKSELNQFIQDKNYEAAFNAAESLYNEYPLDQDCAISYARVLLETGSPDAAIAIIDQTIMDIGSDDQLLAFRAYILTRIGSYDDAVAQFRESLEKQKKRVAWNYYNRSKALAGIELFEEAEKSLKQAISLDKKSENKWLHLEEFIFMAKQLQIGKTKIKSRNIKEYLDISEEAIKKGIHWFVLYIVKQILDSPKLEEYYGYARILELETLKDQFKFSEAKKIADSLKLSLSDNDRFLKIYKDLKHSNFFNKKRNISFGDDSQQKEKPLLPKKPLIDKPVTKFDELESPKNSFIDPNKKRTDFIYYPNDTAEVFSCKAFEHFSGTKTDERIYYEEFNCNRKFHVGVEVVFNNPFFRIETNVFDCKAIWYVNDIVKSTNSFELTVSDEWDSVLFTQTYGSEKENFWSEGQGRVEFYLNNFKICEKFFWLGTEDIEFIDEQAVPPKKEAVQLADSNSSTIEPSSKSLDELLAEMDEFIGLESVKKGVRNFIDYLEFMRERKAKGLKSTEGLSINAVFLGNPGTGKTTIARILGSLFKAMGIVEKGHVVEVDRSALVGQYVGETAQKTEKIIESAMGGILFIDEAYTLVKKGGGGQDFGQEAIDILLKRMEDKKGEFAVIVAGYPKEMEVFLTSNPGMKSRFTQTFIFEDYTPDELLKILYKIIVSEDYKLDPETEVIVIKHLIEVYRKRDETFGNARMVRGFAEDLKMQLSKRYLSLPEKQKTTEAMTTILPEDIQAIIKSDEAKEVSIPINDDALNSAMAELDKLIGLDSVRDDVRNMIKLARYHAEQGSDMKSKFSSHVLFLGNPGTGKTTVARIVSKIYAALGILPKGHLIETDRQNLVASFVGQTAEKTTALIDKSIGGTLFIDEAYTLVKKDAPNDFGKEAIDTLLKRMEDDRGKFIVIGAGYTKEMKDFIDSNPGIKSRFTKTFTFEDYTPDELMKITETILSAKGMDLEEKCKSNLEKHYNEIYRSRDDKFGNARVVRNIIEGALSKQLLRIADLPKEERDEETIKTLITEDIIELKTTQTKKKYEIKGDPEKLKELVEELHNLTGLESVKNSVDKLISGIKIAKLRKERGLQVIDKSLHSVFMGNPGTGKTTIARLMSKIYKELGLLEKGHLVEVDRSDLVAGYQGQTASKTDAIIQQALGGTLFIDEAYTLSRGGNDFGQEAIDTILKRMEDYRGRFIVIVAGYTNEMNTFVESNPGLKSRFSNYFDFEDYNSRQLLTIAAEIADSNGYSFDEGALQLLLELFAEMYEKRDKNFGNARTARNVFHQAVSNQEERISRTDEHSDEALTLITFEDVESITK